MARTEYTRKDAVYVLRPRSMASESDGDRWVGTASSLPRFSRSGLSNWRCPKLWSGCEATRAGPAAPPSLGGIGCSRPVRSPCGILLVPDLAWICFQAFFQFGNQSGFYTVCFLLRQWHLARGRYRTLVLSSGTVISSHSVRLLILLD